MTKDLIKYLISYYQEFVSQISFERREYELEANAIQVSYSLSDPETEKREVDALLNSIRSCRCAS